jgi:hypothetical protein
MGCVCVCVRATIFLHSFCLFFNEIFGFHGSEDIYHYILGNDTVSSGK